MNEQMTRTDQNTSWFSRLWDGLVSADSEVQEAAMRRQASLVAGIALLLAVLSVLGTIGSISANRYMTYGSYLQITLAAFSIPAYFLARSRHYMKGAWLLVVVLFILGYADAFGSNTPEQAVLFYAPFAYILAVGLFTWRKMVVLTLVVAAVSLLLPLFGPQFTMVVTMTVFGLLISVGSLAIAVVSVRDRVEHEHLSDLQKMNAQMQAMNSEMEQRVNERTLDLSLAAEVGRKLSSVQDPNKLLETAVQMIKDRFNLYYTQIYLVDRAGRSLILRAGTGDVGKELIRLNHRLPLDLSSINGSAAMERRPVIVADTTASHTFRPHPLLPQTRSELAIPLISGERVLGVLDLQSSQVGDLSEHDLPVFDTLAGQLAIALINAELFDRLEHSIKEMESYSRSTVRQGWDTYLDAIEQKDRIGYAFDLLATTPLQTPIEPAGDDCAMYVPIKVGSEPVGAFQLAGDSPWLPSDRDIADQVASLVAQRVENLRLFQQADRFRREAEAALRRLTHEEWDSFLTREEKDELAYQYMDGQVLKAAQNGNGHHPVMAFDITVQDEPVGVLALEGVEDLPEEDAALAKTISSVLGEHLEGLRLYTTAQQELVERQRTQEALSGVLISARMGYWELDLATMMFSFTDEFYALLRTTAEAEGGYQMSVEQYAKKFAYPDDMHLVADETRKAIETTDPNYESYVEHRFYYADGELGYLGVSISVVKDENGKTIKTRGANQDITERKRADQALKETFAQVQESERLTRTVIDSTPDWIFIKDQDHRYRLVNQGYANSLHIKAEDFIGKNDIELGFPEEMVKGNPEKNIRGFWADDNEVMRRGEPTLFPNDPAVIDGQVHVFNTLKTPLRDANGEVVGVLAYARDVTERENIMNQTARLYEASRRFSDAGSLDEVVATVCETLNLPDFNRAALMLFDFDEQGEVVATRVAANWHNGIGMPPFPVGLRQTEPIVLDTFKQLITREPVFNEETDENSRSEGVVSGVVLPLWIGDRFLGLMTMQSEVQHRFTEDEMRPAATLAQQAAVAVESRLLLEETIASEARFRETSTQLASALDAAKMANWEYDVPAGEFVFNDTFYNYLRTTAEEMGGYRVPVPVYAGRFVHPEDGPAVGAGIGQALNTDDPNFTQELNARTILADGEVRWTTVRIAIEKDAEGRTVRIIGANQDVTEQRLASEQIESQRRILQAVLDNMPVGVFMVEAPSGKPILANKMVEEFLGRGVSPQAEGAAREELFVTYIAGTDEIYPAEKLPTVAGLAGQATMRNDVEVRKPDGTRVLVQVNGAPVFDQNGEVVASVVVVQDITEARKTQEMIAKRATELARVAEVATTVATIQSPEEMLQTVVDLTQQAFALYHAHIYLLDESGKRLMLTKGAGEVGRKMVTEGRLISLDTEKSLVARAARTRSGVIVNDVRLDPDFLANPLLPDTRSEMAVPMIAGDRLLGVLDIQDEEADRFSHEDANIMTTLAAQVAVSLQNARSYARAQRQAEREALINSISERIQATNSVENSLQVAVREIGRALGAQHTAVRLGLERKSDDASE